MPASLAIFAAAAGPVVLWTLDKAAGGMIERHASRLILGERHKPYVERLIEKMDTLEAEHCSTVHLCEELINERNRWQAMYLEVKRQLEDERQARSATENGLFERLTANFIRRRVLRGDTARPHRNDSTPKAA